MDSLSVWVPPSLALAGPLQPTSSLPPPRPASLHSPADPLPVFSCHSGTPPGRGDPPPATAPLGQQAKPRLLSGPTSPPVCLELGPGSPLSLPPLHPTLEPGKISLCGGTHCWRLVSLHSPAGEWGWDGRTQVPKSPKLCLLLPLLAVQHV